MTKQEQHSPITPLLLRHNHKDSALQVLVAATALLRENGRPAMAAELQRLVDGGMGRLEAVDRFVRRVEVVEVGGSSPAGPAAAGWGTYYVAIRDRRLTESI